MSDGDLTGIGELQALLAQGASFEGKLTFDGRVRIDGRFEGDIFSEGVLVLGGTAEVRGNISVGTLIVRGGKVWGNVRAERLVELYAPAAVHADVASRQLFVDKGVVLDGKCITLEDGPEDTDTAEPRDGAGPDSEPARTEKSEKATSDGHKTAPDAPAAGTITADGEPDETTPGSTP